MGVDPGTATTGYGVVRDRGAGVPELLECGVVRTKAADDLGSRLEQIHAGVLEVISRHHPDVMAVETAFYSRNVHTTLVLGHARGVVLLAAQLQRVALVEYSPATIKKAIVGSGAASKEQVQYMVARLLRLREPPSPNDAADAVAAALAHLQGARLAIRLGGASVRHGTHAVIPAQPRTRNVTPRGPRSG